MEVNDSGDAGFFLLTGDLELIEDDTMLSSSTGVEAAATTVGAETPQDEAVSTTLALTDLSCHCASSNASSASAAPVELRIDASVSAEEDWNTNDSCDAGFFFPSGDLELIEDDTMLSSSTGVEAAATT